jgi:hypothetical protein
VTVEIHLAQVNVARLKTPLDDPSMAEFVALLAEVNAIADKSPGFVWRLQGEEGNATYLRPYDDPLVLFNLSVWRSVESLFAYTYRGAHLAAFKRRREWFLPMDAPHLALWWVPAGHLPGVTEAKARLELLRAHGPTARAFDLKTLFTPALEVLA